MARGFAVLLTALAIVWAVALSIAPLAGQGAVPRPGDPLPGITPREFDAFRAGLNAFTGVESVDEGWGRLNGRVAGRATACRPSAASARWPSFRAGHRNPDGTFRALDADGNTLFHTFSLPNHRLSAGSAAGHQRRRTACRFRCSARA
jgi:hypothetical protein